MKTTHEYRGYNFTLTYAPHDPAYVVDFTDIPEIITSGSTLPEAFRNACEALDLHLESLQKLLPVGRASRAASFCERFVPRAGSDETLAWMGGA